MSRGLVGYLVERIRYYYLEVLKISHREKYIYPRCRPFRNSSTTKHQANIKSTTLNTMKVALFASVIFLSHLGLAIPPPLPVVEPIDAASVIVEPIDPDSGCKP